LSSDLADRDLEIEGLHQEIDDLQEYALHISEVEIDAVNHLAYITVVNPTSIPAIIRSIGFEAGDTYLVNATGIIEPVSSRRFQWSEENAGAPQGFIDSYRSYVVRVETVSGYTFEHWY